MSIGFLIGNHDDAVVWRGPKKNGKLMFKWTEKWNNYTKKPLEKKWYIDNLLIIFYSGLHKYMWVPELSKTQNSAKKPQT